MQLWYRIHLRLIYFEASLRHSLMRLHPRCDMPKIRIPWAVHLYTTIARSYATEVRMKAMTPGDERRVASLRVELRCVALRRVVGTRSRRSRESQSCMRIARDWVHLWGSASSRVARPSLSRARGWSFSLIPWNLRKVARQPWRTRARREIRGRLE